MNHVAIVIIMALAAHGAQLAMFEGYILHPLKRLLQWIVPIRFKLSKPLYSCGNCMVSVWGGSFVLLLGMLPITEAWKLPAYFIMAVAVRELIP